MLQVLVQIEFPLRLQAQQENLAATQRQQLKQAETKQRARNDDVVHA